jgi:phosphate transport system protein
MRNKFEEQLAELNNKLIEMGALIERSIAHAIKAMIEQDVVLAQKVIDYDDEIDQKERDIETLCFKLLLQQQPVAKDLRLISAALKMITDMERIGDQAADISQITIYLAKEEYIKQLIHIPQMAEATIKMVTDSINAFVNKDLELARAVSEHDDVVDDLFYTIKSELIALIHENISNGQQALDLLMIAKYFERIGDHAVNIGEWVIFSITGIHGKKMYRDLKNV